MSERKLASIQTILSLSPIAGADAILLAKVLGWELVEFLIGDIFTQKCSFTETQLYLLVYEYKKYTNVL